MTIEKLQHQLDYHYANLAWIEEWEDRIEDTYADDSRKCAVMLQETNDEIADLKQALAIEKIVQLCLTGK